MIMLGMVSMSVVGDLYYKVAHSPIAHSPIAHSPIAYTPIAYTPIAYTPIAYTPIAHFPIAHSPIAQFQIDNNLVNISPLRNHTPLNANSLLPQSQLATYQLARSTLTHSQGANSPISSCNLSHFSLPVVTYVTPVLITTPLEILHSVTPICPPKYYQSPQLPKTSTNLKLGSSLNEETIPGIGSMLDQTLPACLSPQTSDTKVIPNKPPLTWVSTTIWGDDGRVRGVRLRRTAPLSPPPASLSDGMETSLPALNNPKLCCHFCKKEMSINSANQEICKKCLLTIFPFQAVPSTRELVETLNGPLIKKSYIEKATKQRFNPLDETIRDSLTDLNQAIQNCQYYLANTILKSILSYSELPVLPCVEYLPDIRFFFLEHSLVTSNTRNHLTSTQNIPQ